MNHSRSSLETYLSCCQYRHYLNYQFDNGPNEVRGIQPIEKSIDLEAGTLAHAICGNTLSYFIGASQTTPERNLEIFHEALEIGLEEFRANSHLMFDRKIDQDNEEMKFQTIEEHENLIHALAYLWFKTEFQFILENYQVITTEKEIISEICEGHKLLSRVDALLYHRENKEFVTWSLKTTKMLGWFTNAMENGDLQGYLEMFAANNFLDQTKIKTEKFIESIQLFNPDDKASLMKFLAKRFPDGDKVSSVRFCFLVKGDRKSYKNTPYPFRQNPLIYGWRKANNPSKPVSSLKGGYTEEEIELASKMVSEYSYAHSFDFYNPVNQSGIGKLGKGWEKFSVWKEFEGGIESWIDQIASGLIQPEAKSPLENFIKAETTSRDDLMLEKTLNYIRATVIEIEQKLNLPTNTQFLDVKFLPNTKSCDIPVSCDFKLVCPYSGVGEKEWTEHPLRENNEGIRLFQIRQPHHPEGVSELKK